MNHEQQQEDWDLFGRTFCAASHPRHDGSSLGATVLLMSCLAGL
jgi:hypothetical protein